MTNINTQTERPKISIIVPSYNRAHYLTGALETLTSQETDGRFTYDVIVVDNASTDNTRKVVQDFTPKSDIAVRYLFESTPGDAPPRNAGIRASNADWLAFFDDDQFAESRWLLNLLTAAETHQAQLVGGPVHLDLDEDIRQHLSPACRSTLREMMPYESDQPYAPDVIPGTGNLFVARTLFDTIGLFAEDIKEGGSDWKLVEDARGIGIVPWYASAAVIRHRVETNRMTPAYFQWDSRNGGVSQADSDYRNNGFSGLLLRGIARMIRAAVFLPAHLLAGIAPPKYGTAESSMVCWRTEGYLRRCLTLLAPRVFPQKQFYEYVDFRSGRVVGT